MACGCPVDIRLSHGHPDIFGTAPDGHGIANLLSHSHPDGFGLSKCHQDGFGLSQSHPDGFGLSQSHPDGFGIANLLYQMCTDCFVTANFCPKAIWMPMGQPMLLPKAIRMPTGQLMSLPQAIRTPMGRFVTHLGQLWMAMEMRTGMGWAPLGRNRPTHQSPYNSFDSTHNLLDPFFNKTSLSPLSSSHCFGIA